MQQATAELTGVLKGSVKSLCFQGLAHVVQYAILATMTFKVLLFGWNEPL